ncbi:dihydropteroate synthase [Mycobacterium dioxanotrophicus]|nr:dihydropteroate synthase [Mycobacterium dioxanotrophicus]
MGIINVTPDSFSDGGQYHARSAAIRLADDLVDSGAGWLDIGGESTRPGAMPVDEATELGRVIPAVRTIAARHRLPISIDTSKSVVAERAIDAGATIVNDVTGGCADPDVLSVVKGAPARFIIGHWPKHIPERYRDTRPGADCAERVFVELERLVTSAVDAGLEPSQLLVDPGIGFGKEMVDNWSILRNLSRLADRCRLPIVVGVSRKRLLADRTPDVPNERDFATSSLHAQLMNAGSVDVLRAHNIVALRQAALVAQRWSGVVSEEDR